MTEPKINVTSGNYEIEYDIKDDNTVDWLISVNDEPQQTGKADNWNEAVAETTEATKPINNYE